MGCLKQSKASAESKDMLLNVENEIFYSTASVWEITIKHMLHPDKLRMSGSLLAKGCEDNGYIALPVLNQHVSALETLKPGIIPTIIFAISLCVGCQAGCGEPEVLFSDTLPVASDEPEIKDNKVEKIGVCVDATPSMKGFLGMQKEFYKKLVGETVYLTCLDELDKLLSVKYDREDMDYYRVDTSLWWTEENVLKKAKDAAFYCDKLYAGNKKKYKKID